MRVWLEILRERHPGTTWVTADRDIQPAITTEEVGEQMEEVSRLADSARLLPDAA
jgi:hypothetical protein